MNVYIEEKGETKQLAFTGNALNLLKKLSINPETVLITKNGQLITEEDEISNEDEIKLLSVISGG